MSRAVLVFSITLCYACPQRVVLCALIFHFLFIWHKNCTSKCELRNFGSLQNEDDLSQLLLLTRAEHKSLLIDIERLRY